jgi:SOS response regulatory protein OraA/RecX
VGTTIVRIENAGPGLRARRLVFEDGSEPRLTSKAALKELGLEVGAETSPETLEAALSEIELPLAKDRALMLLGYREHSQFELAKKLRECGYPRDIAEAVVKRFVEVQLVDDARFAASWVRSRRSARYGTRRIKQELDRKGISEDVVLAALEEESPDGDDELARAQAALGARVAEDRKGRDKLVRRLVGRGFSLGVAIEAVNSSAASGCDTMDTPSDLH